MGGFDGHMLFLLGAFALIGFVVTAIGLSCLLRRRLSDMAYGETVVDLEYYGVFAEQARGFTPPEDLLLSWRRLHGIRALCIGLALLLGLGIYCLIAISTGSTLWQTAPSGLGLLVIVVWSSFGAGLLLCGPFSLVLAPRRQPSAEDARWPVDLPGFRRSSLFVLVAIVAVDVAVAIWAMLTGHTSLVMDSGGTIPYPFWAGSVLLVSVLPIGWLAKRWIARVAPRRFTHDAAWAASADRDIRRWLAGQTRFLSALAIYNIGLMQAITFSWERHSWPYPLALMLAQFAVLLVAVFELGGRTRPARPEAEAVAPEA